jgi:hypothetical protein
VIASWCRGAVAGGTGAGLRVRPADLDAGPALLRPMLGTLGLPRRRVDLVVDLGRPVGRTTPEPRAIVSLLEGAAPLAAWRRVVLTGGSFPPKLWTRMGHDERARFRRHEQDLFDAVAARVGATTPLVFGDHGVVTTVPSTTRFRGAATIRYTSGHDWWVLRGFPPDKAPADDHARLARELTESDHWRGVDHCAGCRFIAGHAAPAGKGGGGNATQWRQADFAHHMISVHEILADRRDQTAAS